MNQPSTKNASMFHPPNTNRKEPESSLRIGGGRGLPALRTRMIYWALVVMGRRGVKQVAPTDGFEKVPLFSMAWVMIPICRVFGVPMNHWIGLRENL